MAVVKGDFWPGLGQVSHNWIRKISHQNPNFSIFSLQVKKNLIASGKKYLGQRQVGPLFTWGQKYARVRFSRPMVLEMQYLGWAKVGPVSKRVSSQHSPVIVVIDLKFGVKPYFPDQK